MLKKVLTVAVAMSVLGAGALPAFADDHEPVKVYDEEQHILMFAVDGECMLDAEMDIAFTVDDEGAISFEVVTEEDEVVEGETTEPIVVDEDEVTDPLQNCYPFSVEGPNGQVNHGTFVSNLMHALKEMGIKGSDKKAFKAALKGYGKGDMKVKVKDVDDELSMDEGDSDEDDVSDSAKVKPDKAEKTNKGQTKKANKGQNK